MRSTAEWEAALEGPTTGPWWTETQPRLRYANGETWEEIGDILICSDAELAPLMSLPEQIAEDEQQGPNNLSNAKLAALAPEAVAEVVRLRRALEERVRIWQKVAEKLENRGDEDGASQARHTVAVVTRILDGTHE